MDDGNDSFGRRPDNETVMRDYLLGRLDESGRERLEAEYFSNDSALEYLEAVEDQLIDEYLSGVLPDRGRVQFRDHFLRSKDRQERLRFAQTLRACARERADRAGMDRAGPPAARFWRTRTRGLTWTLAGACALVAVWLGVELMSSKIDGERPQQQIAGRDSASAVTSELGSGTQSTLAHISLRPDLSRGGAAANALRLSPEIHSIQFTLLLPGPAAAKDYRASVRVVESDEPIWVQGMLRPTKLPDGDSVICVVPASVLSDHVYVVELSRAEGFRFVPVASYVFTASEN